MKTLYLLRHAQAEPPGAAATDFERALTPAGAATARCLGGALQARGWRPEAIRCSAARRAVQTWEAMAPAFAADFAPQFLRSLYLAPPSRLVAALRRLPDGPASVLVIAHNPGIHSLAMAMTRAGADAPEMAGLRANYPPAALCVFALAIDTWKAFGPELGKLSQVLRPSDLVPGHPA